MNMKIVDENGVELTGEPDLALGRLVDDVEIVHHEAVEGVQQVSHFVPIEYLANGSTIVDEIIDVPGVDPQPAWDETVPIQRYIKYTQEELDEQERQREHESQMNQMPDTVARLKAENEALRESFAAMEAALDEIVKEKIEAQKAAWEAAPTMHMHMMESGTNGAHTFDLPNLHKHHYEVPYTVNIANGCFACRPEDCEGLTGWVPTFLYDMKKKEDVDA